MKEIRKILPDESVVYYADTAHCPYGEKSREYIIERARFITETLMARGASVIVVACNTATAAAIASLRQEYPDTPSSAWNRQSNRQHSAQRLAS